jgi:hypothetical protein
LDVPHKTISKDLEGVGETKLMTIREFAMTLLVTWTTTHLGCGKKKKMNGKQVWTIAF